MTDTNRLTDAELEREAELIEAQNWHPNHSQNQLARALRELLAYRRAGVAVKQEMGGGDVIALVAPDRWQVEPQLAYANGWNDAPVTPPPASSADADLRGAAEPDYCYDPEDWEYTQPWDARHEMAEGIFEYRRGDPVARVCTLIKGPEKWVANVPLDTDGDGEADDWEIQWFDSEEAARTALSTPAPSRPDEDLKELVALEVASIAYNVGWNAGIEAVRKGLSVENGSAADYTLRALALPAPTADGAE